MLINNAYRSDRRLQTTIHSVRYLDRATRDDEYLSTCTKSIRFLNGNACSPAAVQKRVSPQAGQRYTTLHPDFGEC